MAQEESGRRRLTRFVTSAKGAVLTIGALAGAVGAVIALLPKHEHAPSTLNASFSNVKATPNVDLQEYEERFAPHPVARIDSRGAHSTAVLRVPYRLVAATSSATPATPATPSDPPSASESPSTPGGESEETPPDTSTSTTPSESTTSSTTTTDTGETTGETTTTEASSGSDEGSSAPFKETNGVLARDGNGSDPEAEHAVAEAMSEIEIPLQQIAAAKSPEGESAEVVVPEACDSSSCAVTPMIDNALATDPDPVKAAHAVAHAFANSRGRVIDNKLYPSGVAVNYTIDLTGWAGQEARLEWSLWSQTEGRPLPKPWLRNVIAKEIKPKIDNGSFSGIFWIPAPPRHGDYVVHLTVYDSDHVEHGETETEPPFH